MLIDPAAAAPPCDATAGAVVELPTVRAGSVVDAKYLRARLQKYLGHLGGATQARAYLAALVELAREKHIHLMLERPAPAGGGYFQSWGEFCTTPAPHGLGYHLDAIELLLAERQDLRTQARLARPLGAHGTHGPYRPERRAAAGVAPPEARIKAGTGRRYWLAKLARDRPDLLARVESGELGSTQQAAILAGWTSPLTWVRCTAESFAAQAMKHLPAEEVPRLIAFLQAPATIPHPQGRTPPRRRQAAA